MNTENTILLVDDDPTNLKVLSEALKEMGHKILMAPSGKRALYQIANHPADLILMDVLMPEMDGFETCRRLKENPATTHTPIIFMTALSDVENKVKGFAAGGVDYITKPFQQAEVQARVNTHLTIHTLQKQLKAQNVQLRDKNAHLKAALDKVKQLSGMLPICANCKKIRDDEGYWQQVEIYIRSHSEAEFTHGICPDCIDKLYPDLFKDD